MFTIQNGEEALPDYLQRKRSLILLEKSTHTSQYYKDKLCLFHCLALCHGHSRKGLERPNKRFFETWCREHQLTEDKFCGVPLKELPNFESLFQVNIFVYNLSEDSHVTCVYHSCKKHGEKNMYLHLYSNKHFSYITNFKALAQKFRCELCSMAFKDISNYNHHRKNCRNNTKESFPGGFLKTDGGVFQDLEEVGMHVPQHLRMNKYFCVFDIEAVLEPLDRGDDAKLQLLSCYCLVSVAVASNVEGYRESTCIINDDLDCLVRSLLQVLREIQRKATALLYEEVRFVEECLQEVREEWTHILSSNAEERAECQIPSHQETESEDEGEEGEMASGVPSTSSSKQSHLKKALQHIDRVALRFKHWYTKLPGVGFNSDKYDLPILRESLFKQLGLVEQNGGFVLKKGSSYVQLSTDEFVFLDLKNVVCPGDSYDSFLLSFNRQNNRKSHFPYE